MNEENPCHQLSEPQRQMLETQLYMESVDILKRFSQLTMRAEDHLENTPVQKLVTCVMGVESITYPGQKSPLNELGKAESASHVFKILVEKKLISFLLYNILEHIINTFCTSNAELMKELKTYKEHFTSYVKRRVCENYLFQRGEIKMFDGKEPLTSTPHLVVITDHTWGSNEEFDKTLELRTHLVNIFGIKEFYLDLKSIRLNCLRLYYAVPCFLDEVVFPLTPEQEEKLRDYGIAEIMFGDYHYVLKKCKALFIFLLHGKTYNIHRNILQCIYIYFCLKHCGIISLLFSIAIEPMTQPEDSEDTKRNLKNIKKRGTFGITQMNMHVF